MSRDKITRPEFNKTLDITSEDLLYYPPHPKQVSLRWRHKENKTVRKRAGTHILESDGGDRRKFWKEPLKGTRISFCGCDSNSCSPLRGTNSTENKTSSRYIFFRLQHPKRYTGITLMAFILDLNTLSGTKPWHFTPKRWEEVHKNKNKDFFSKMYSYFLVLSLIPLACEQALSGFFFLILSQNPKRASVFAGYNPSFSLILFIL